MIREYRADIQGLRGISVLAVLLFHFDRLIAPGGFVGVDVFFVISGFLITQGILKDLNSGTFSLRDFYERRARRIFPALFVVLMFTFLAGYFVFSPQDYYQACITILTTLLFVSNFFFARLTGYFDGSGELRPLLHTWSLAVEEQFYLVMPLALMLIRRFRQNLAAPAIAAGLVASLIACVWMTGERASTAFFMTPFRAFELLIGAFVATDSLAPIRRPSLRDALSCVGLALILGSMVFFNHAMPYPGYLALVPCLGAALVIHSGKSFSTVGGWLIGGGVLRFFGDISYSLYLWHWPLLVFAKYRLAGEPSLIENALIALVAVGLAALSQRMVEKPFLRSGGSLTRTFGIGLVGLMTVGCAAAIATGGLPGRFQPAAQKLFASADDYNRQRDGCHADEFHQIAYSDSCVFGSAGAAPRWAVFGDSHGAELSVALGQRASNSAGGVMELTSSACPPAIGYEVSYRPGCVAENRRKLEALSGDHRISTVVLAVDFLEYPRDDWGALSSGYRRMIKQLISVGKSVVLFKQIPVMPFDPPNELGLAASRGEDLRLIGQSRAAYDSLSRESSALIDEIHREQAIEAIESASVFCDADLCHAYEPDAGSQYFNRAHLSVSGALRLADEIWRMTNAVATMAR